MSETLFTFTAPCLVCGEHARVRPLLGMPVTACMRCGTYNVGEWAPILPEGQGPQQYSSDYSSQVDFFSEVSVNALYL